jgi:hypothetical protein
MIIKNMTIKLRDTFIHSIWNPFIASLYVAFLICPLFLLSYYHPYLKFFEKCYTNNENILVCKNLLGTNENGEYWVFYFLNLFCLLIYLIIHIKLFESSNDIDYAIHNKKINNYVLCGAIISYIMLNISTYYLTCNLITVMFMVLHGLFTPYIIATILILVKYMFYETINESKIK